MSDFDASGTLLSPTSFTPGPSGGIKKDKILRSYARAFPRACSWGASVFSQGHLMFLINYSEGYGRAGHDCRHLQVSELSMSYSFSKSSHGSYNWRGAMEESGSREDPNVCIHASFRKG